MIQFTAILQQFPQQGEKTGWTYLEVPPELLAKLKPKNKKSFRVKGKLDNFNFAGIGLIPMGEGRFILTVNAALRKGIRKRKGASVQVQMKVDRYEKPLSAELLECLADEPLAYEKFKSLTKSHQRYFSNWIETAKTELTKTKRITQAIIALSMGLGFSEMLRRNKKS